MIKAGILSMQRIANYGSFLQAYGLKKILEELGCEVEFVDYHPGPTLIKSDSGKGLKRKIFKILEVLKCNASIIDKIRFIKYKKNYVNKYYSYLESNTKMNYHPKVDLLVIGSDEVFNCVQDNPNVGFSPELFGAGSNAQRVITYAASFGNTTEEKLKKYKISDTVSRYLSRIDAISVRDSNSCYIVNKLTHIEPEYNLDPVLIYDYMGKCKMIPKTISSDKYMILYGYSSRFNTEECEKVKRYAKNNGLKIYCIGGIQDGCDQFIDCNPFEVIAYFKNAESIITDTFHGTIMSVITHKKFISIVRKNGYGNAEKMTDLIERLKLEDRIMENLNQLQEVMSREIDYKKIEQILSLERQKSYNYLEKQIIAINKEGKYGTRNTDSF